MPTLLRTGATAAVLVVALSPAATAQTARVWEEVRELTTYPFSEPNGVPILTRDPRLYPYHSFEGYAIESVPREWRVVHLENEFIEVFVLPEVGGKVWGAIVKSTGHEFIYRNEVMKFRNIALRGPWTSGGIEFNFGVIGHTPATATPVDYVLRENADGSVSCIVGTMDLPSRTHWRVEIRLPPDRAYFETNVLWYNPTPLQQPYYNWMTAAAFAREDLEMSIPGNSYLTHPGDQRSWPVDYAGRYLPRYANNTFESHKSYHVVGELNDFFGGYYHDEHYGFGHWARYDDMPGQKLWLWALSRQGGVWEELLTDSDGQYVEFQAGRLLVQYSPGADLNPITQASFGPGVTDRWSETWFPLEGIGGLTDASREGAMHVRHESGLLVININAFGDGSDTLRVTSGDSTVAIVPLDFAALEPVRRIYGLADGEPFRVQLPGLGLDYSSDPASRELTRPFSTPGIAGSLIPPVDRQVFEARELLRARRYAPARALFDSALVREPWHREALLGMADLEYRRGMFGSALNHVNRALQLDGYDAEGNFLAGNIYRALGQPVDAREAYGWAARSLEFRSAAYVQLAELMLVGGDPAEAQIYARSALDYDRYNLPARQVLAMVARNEGDAATAARLRREMIEIDPLHHFVFAEEFLDGGDPASMLAALRSEYPDQTLLELASDYVRRGDTAAAVALLQEGPAPNPLLNAWRAWLTDEPGELGPADPAFVFPFRVETLPVLRWAAERSHWSWSYLLALNLWALDREEEAAGILDALGDAPDFAPAYVARAALLDRLRGRDGEADLRRAVRLDPADRILRVYLVRYLLDRELWEEAAVAATHARDDFPGDFNLDLLYVRALLHLDRPGDAVGVLVDTRVLPSENSRESHRLWERAHTLAGLDALDRDDVAGAVRLLRAGLEWPEHLGQGRPYEPDERVLQYLVGVAEERAGNDGASRTAYEAVSAFTHLADPALGPADVVAIPAMAALGRLDEARAASVGWTTIAGRLARELIRAIDAGVVGEERAASLDTSFRAVFDGIDGRILLRTLLVQRR